MSAGGCCFLWQLKLLGSCCHVVCWGLPFFVAADIELSAVVGMVTVVGVTTVSGHCGPGTVFRMLFLCGDRHLCCCICSRV